MEKEILLHHASVSFAVLYSMVELNMYWSTVPSITPSIYINMSGKCVSRGIHLYFIIRNRGICDEVSL